MSDLATLQLGILMVIFVAAWMAWGFWASLAISLISFLLMGAAS